MSWHLAQVNIARTKAPFDASAMTGLTSRIAEMNALAESSPGFVWRFTAGSDADNRLELLSDYLVPFDRGRFFFNMSVWKSVDDLRDYAFKTAHLELFRDRHAWMDSFPHAHAAMWWLPAGKTPTVADAKTRLLSVDQHGPTDFAFTFAKPFPPPASTGATS
jgi:hypothetical protein